MHAQHPDLAVSFHHLQLARQIGFSISHLSLEDLALEITWITDPIRGINVDHLHFARQILTPGQRRHHQEAVAQDHPVRPVHLVLVELHCLAVVLLGVGEEVALDVLAGGGGNGGLGADALVDVDGDRIDGEAGQLALAGPLQPRLWWRRASARVRASSGVKARLVASCSSAGRRSAAPVVSKRRAGGRRGL